MKKPLFRQRGKVLNFLRKPMDHWLLEPYYSQFEYFNSLNITSNSNNKLKIVIYC